MYRLIYWLRCTEGCKGVREIDGSTLSIEQWREFEKSSIWAAFLFDLSSRKAYLTKLLIEGHDPDWNDDMLRGKLSELDFLENLPASIKASIVIETKQNTTGQEEELDEE